MSVAPALPVTARRILVYGVTGAGKSTLARRLACALALPYHEVDALTWEPGWVAVPEEEQRRRIAAICAGPEWLLDSAYGSWLDLALDRVELVVGLDYPRWFSLQRLARRTVARQLDRQQICNGNAESLRGIFSRESILLWHFRSFSRKRRRIRAWEAHPGDPAALRLDSARTAQRWLAGVSGGRATPGI